MTVARIARTPECPTQSPPYPTSIGLTIPLDTHPASALAAYLSTLLHSPDYTRYPIHIAAVERWRAVFPSLEKEGSTALEQGGLTELFHICDDMIFAADVFDAAKVGKALHAFGF